MGLATPKTGQIAFSDLNTGILNASSSAQLNMNDAAFRLGYSTTGQVSLSQLRGCTGGEFTIGFAYDSKLGLEYYGYSEYSQYGGGFGSATGTLYRTNDGEVESIYNITFTLGSPGAGTTFLLYDPDGFYGNPAAGWTGDDVTRAAIANVQRSIGSTTVISVDVTYTMATSGTTTWGLKFG